MSRSRIPLAAAAAGAMVVGLVAITAPASYAKTRTTGPAPGAPGEASTWAPGDKDGFGAAHTASSSKVWYTLNNGALTEVFYPRIDTPSIRETQFVVSDGKTFTDREDEDTVA